MRNLHIDRLRGVASLGVVLSHASGYGFLNALYYLLPTSIMVAVAANAYHAVVLFFVISGFLITTKLLNDERINGRISLARFYRDRFARIAPCLVLMLTVAIGLAAIGLQAFALDWDYLPEALFRVITFRYNTWFSPQVPHVWSRAWDVLWSLSIEEVFYLISPMLLLVLPRRLLLGVLAMAIVVGPFHRGVTGSYYAYLSNFDALAIGSITAIIADRFKHGVSSLALRGLRWLGVLIIAVATYCTTDPATAIVWGAECVSIGPDEYSHTRGDQDDACAICGAPFSVNTPHIDHCHESGRIRGFLCSACNFGLGHFNDDPIRLVSAVRYLGLRAGTDVEALRAGLQWALQSIDTPKV